MAHDPRTSDPRSVVTSEAFELAPELLGRPLAPPRRRLAAIVVDLILIGLLSQAGGLLLGVAATFFIFRIAAGGPVNEALRKTFRVAVGCFGGVVLLVTGCALFFTVGPGGDDGGPMDALRDELAGPEEPAATEGLGLGDVFSGMSEVRALRNAESDADARAAATRLARRLRRVGAPTGDIRQLLTELSRDASIDAEADAVADFALAAVDSAEAGAGAADSTSGAAAAEAEAPPPEARPVASLALVDVLDEYADSLRAREPSPAGERGGDRSRIDALQRRIVDALAGDTLEALSAELRDETEDREVAERRLESTRQRLQEVREGPVLLRWIGDRIDDLGLAFGWGGIYMTIFLAWWNGQTPGKKLLGTRVVQLDNSPITWWEAFERAGGYAAGFATGLLGFVQIYWDPNRQAIHDKISETVVVLDGRDPLPGFRPGEKPDGSEPTRVGSPV